MIHLPLLSSSKQHLSCTSSTKPNQTELSPELPLKVKEKVEHDIFVSHSITSSSYQTKQSIISFVGVGNDVTLCLRMEPLSLIPVIIYFTNFIILPLHRLQYSTRNFKLVIGFPTLKAITKTVAQISLHSLMVLVVSTYRIFLTKFSVKYLSSIWSDILSFFECT